MSELTDRIGTYWNNAAATYEQAPGHHPQTPLEWAAWRAVLARLLPPTPARVLDIGAGTGVLTLTAAQLGHTVTALDLAPAMLARLRATAASGGVEVDTIHAPANEPPPGPWDVVMSRHLLWTLPDPTAALRAWRAVAPTGHLLLVESLWGDVKDPIERARARMAGWLRQIRGTGHGHDGHYDQAMCDQLPLATGATSHVYLDTVTAAGWSWPRIQRLSDVEWAMRQGQPLPERLLGVNTIFALAAG